MSKNSLSILYRIGSPTLGEVVIEDNKFQALELLRSEGPNASMDELVYKVEYDRVSQELESQVGLSREDGIKIAKQEAEIERLLEENKKLYELAQSWMRDHDALKEKYEPMRATLSEEEN